MPQHSPSLATHTIHPWPRCWARRRRTHRAGEPPPEPDGGFSFDLCLQAAEIAAPVAKFRERWGEPTPEAMADLIALTTKPCRPYRDRYAGIVRQIARNNGLHPIRDRELIRALLPRLIGLAKQLKWQTRKWQYKYRNMEIIDNGDGSYGLRGIWTTAGPTM